MKAVRLWVSGVVQGVGFRPFVYRIARETGVSGYVRNVGGSGVEIIVEGEAEKVDEFIHLLQTRKPEKARIDKFSATSIEPRGYTCFEIMESDVSASFRSIIPPDFAICGDCLNEILSDTRWRNYPFNSCANCGPRYSMLYRVPYDRENTSMRDFPMCNDCLRDYSDPDNVRRFHAQGISCPACGPSVYLVDCKGGFQVGGLEAVIEAAKLIDDGCIVAVKGLGGYHIAASAVDDDVVALLRRRKNRPTKPFAIMCLNADVASLLVELTSPTLELLESPMRPILLLPMRGDVPVSPLVAPNLKKLGVFLPYTGLHYLLLSFTKQRYTIMTSGNIYNEPMCTRDDEALEKLADIVDFFLMHNREIVNRVDDSVVRFTDQKPTMLRRGRGYAPQWIQIPFKTEREVVAFGAMLQTAGAVAFDDKIVLTQFIGDVDGYTSFTDLEKYLNTLVTSYGITLESAVNVCDLHPLYPSTLLAEEWSRRFGSELLRVQHHWAHTAAVMAEHGVVDEEVVGISVDGVGYGVDGTAWGGEVVLADYSSFKRVGCLKPQKMPGGDRAVEYPARMLAGILSEKLTVEELRMVFRELGLVEKGFRRGWEEFELVLRNIENTVARTSSTGRVLDAVSAMLGFCTHRSYEGEPAIVLEDNSKPTEEKIRPRITNGDIHVVDSTDIVLQALELVRNGADRREVGYMVQYAVGFGLGRIAGIYSRGRRYVVLSGGASVNTYLVEGVKDALQDTGLTILLPSQAPAGDGGIALGQAAIAAYRTLTRP